MRLLVEIGGRLVPLAECVWVRRGPCGCPYGVTTARSALTEDAAWKTFCARRRDRDRARRAGSRLELMTHERWPAEVADRMKVRCTHVRGGDRR